MVVFSMFKSNSLINLISYVFSMDNQLKKNVLDKIKEIYPRISSNDMIILYGSRAKGVSLKDSDIDIMIFTDNYDYFKRISIEKGLRKSCEDPGFEIRLDNGLLLETKIEHTKIPKFDIIFCHDILNARGLTSISRFKIFQRKIKKQFMEHYDDLLFNSYMHFFSEFKNIQGISKRNDKFSRINLSMTKGIVIQALLRLILVMDKQPYPYDKYLAHEASKTKHWKTISNLVKKINAIDSLEDYAKVYALLKSYLNLSMPKKPYVGCWWKYLKQFKG